MNRLEASWGGWGEVPSEISRQRIVIVAHKGALFEGLAKLLSHHLSSASVDLIEDTAELEATAALADLVLVHHRNCIEGCADLERFHKAMPKAAIAVLIDRPEDGQEWTAHANGALLQGCLPLNLRLQVLMAAVALLLSGGQFFPRTQEGGARGDPTAEPPGVEVDLAGARSVSAEMDDIGANQLNELTTRERQILSLVAQGLQNKLIADRMSLSEHTVKVHVHNLMNKLNVSNRTQAAAAYHGLPYRSGQPSMMAGR